MLYIVYIPDWGGRTPVMCIERQMKWWSNTCQVCLYCFWCFCQTSILHVYRCTHSQMIVQNHNTSIATIQYNAWIKLGPTSLKINNFTPQSIFPNYCGHLKWIQGVKFVIVSHLQQKNRHHKRFGASRSTLMRSTPTRSTPIWSTLTRSTVREINSHEINYQIMMWIVLIQSQSCVVFYGI